MKKRISLFLILLLVFSLWSCRKEETIQFYYPRAEIQYGFDNGLIVAEDRNIEGADRSLEFLLKLYLEGPISQELRSPFPKGTALEDLSRDENIIILTLSDPFAELENMDYMIACACVSSTCFSLTDAYSVTIVAGQNEMTLTRDSLALTDQAISTPD